MEGVGIKQEPMQHQVNQVNQANQGQLGGKSIGLALGIGGKGGKGLGKSVSVFKGAARHRKIICESIMGVTKPAIRRIARRGGVKRMSGMFLKLISSRL